jgi:cell division protein FtsW (lipid II flippase)
MAQIANRLPSAWRSYRWRELSLLILPITLMLLAMTQLLLGKLDSSTTVDLRNLPVLQGLIPIFGLITALLVAHIILTIFFREADQMVLPLVGILSGLGVLMATRLSSSRSVGNPSLGSSQLMWVILGLVICLTVVFGLRNIQWLARYKYIVALIGIGLFCTTLVNSIIALRIDPDSPTHDQLKLGPFSFQPSELFKICIVAFFAAYLSENRVMLTEGSWRLGKLKLPPLRQLGPLICMLFASLLLFLFVRELGLAMLTYSTFLSMIYFGTGKISFVSFSLVVAIIFGFIGYSLLGYVRNRFAILGFDVIHWQSWTPYEEDLATGKFMQVLQGLIALSSGGLIGAGLGLGYPGLVPVVSTDLVLVAFGEELGLVGLFAILGLYLLLVYRGFHIAIEATNTFNQLLAAGLTAIFALQTFIIAAGNLKIMPLTGIPLPFLSYGGSSIIGNFIMIGILLRISYNTKRERMGLA